jgi:serine/threonine protein kinase
MTELWWCCEKGSEKRRWRGRWRRRYYFSSPYKMSSTSSSSMSPPLPVTMIANAVRSTSPAVLSTSTEEEPFIISADADQYKIAKNSEAYNGTYGTVTIRHYHDGSTVAFKSIDMEKTVLRDTLLSESCVRGCDHPSVMPIQRILYTPDGDTVCAVYPKADTDLYRYITGDYDSNPAIPSYDQLNTMQVRSIMLQIACGLAYCHSCLIGHFDIKQDNVLVMPAPTPPGNGISNVVPVRVSLTDFGLSEFPVFEVAQRSLKYSKQTRPPEMCTPNSTCYGLTSLKSDVWALGSLFLWMLTGHHGLYDNLAQRFLSFDSVPEDGLDLYVCKEHISGIPTGATRKKWYWWLHRFPTFHEEARFDFSVLDAKQAGISDLISRMLHHDPEVRPTAYEVVHHPFFSPVRTQTMQALNIPAIPKPMDLVYNPQHKIERIDIDPAYVLALYDRISSSDPFVTLECVDDADTGLLCEVKQTIFANVMSNTADIGIAERALTYASRSISSIHPAPLGQLRKSGTKFPRVLAFVCHRLAWTRTTLSDIIDYIDDLVPGISYEDFTEIEQSVLKALNYDVNAITGADYFKQMCRRDRLMGDSNLQAYSAGCMIYALSMLGICGTWTCKRRAAACFAIITRDYATATTGSHEDQKTMLDAVRYILLDTHTIQIVRDVLRLVPYEMRRLERLVTTKIDF